MSLPVGMRSAYERGRLRDALNSTLPLLALPIVGIALSRCALGAVAVGVVLVLGFVLARWRGQSWSQGAVVGAIAGAIAAAAPIGLALDGAGCVGPACPSWCARVCCAAGLIAGVILGFRARDLRALATGTLVAATAAALGCWPMGLAMVGSAAGAIVFGALGGRFGRYTLGG